MTGAVGTMALILAVAVGGSGCESMSTTEKRAIGGTAMGAAGGAALGAIAGNAGMGAAIGAGVGLLGGIVYDQYDKSKTQSYEQGVRDGRAGR
jgi:hypothetical protein